MRANAGSVGFAVWMTEHGGWANAEATSLQAAIELENPTQIPVRTTGEPGRAARAPVGRRRADG